ncbi:MAG: diguanylate cyclase [Candidatus Omnitrophica bacterium]|nr:diguanylate cyclase [Candidatus Omnitrophota bacterium]MDD5610006.1 diguanylate cyclase [Candidatus Omnitrophota bacterium]
MLRAIAIAVLFLIIRFLFLQNNAWQSNILLLIALGLITIVATYRYPLIKGLVIATALLYAFILLSFYTLWAGARFHDYLAPASVILVTYACVALYKYFSCFAKGIQLKDKALIDTSTGLYIQRYFEVRLESEFNQAMRRCYPFSVVAVSFDADLKSVSLIIKNYSRKQDFVAYCGKEKIYALLPGTKEKGALVYAEKLKKAVENTLKVNISLGIVNYPDADAGSWQKILEYAEEALRKSQETRAIYVYRNH